MSEICQISICLKGKFWWFQPFLNFRLIGKMLTPYLINFRHFLIWEHIDCGGTPRINILKVFFRHIYIAKGQIKCFNFFSFLGWGLRVTYNWDIFEKLRPPPSFFKCPNLNLRHFCLFFIPPPLFGTLSQIFLFFNYDASP